jgi:hypothetical protein
MSETKVEQPAQAAARLNKEGKFSEALALVAPLVEKGDKQPIAYLQMSRALRGLKDDKAAREVEQRALELFPDNHRVAAHVGYLLVSTDRDFAKAVDLVSPHLAAGRIEPDLAVIASVALRALKRESEADAVELKGLAAHPDNAQLLTRRVTVLNRGGKFADAVALIAGKDAVVEASPGLKTQLQSARDGLAVGAAKPATAPSGKADAAPSVPVTMAAASAVAAKPASAAGPVGGPSSASASRPTALASAAAPAAEVSKPATQSVPATTPARPASAPTPTSAPAQAAARASQPATSSKAALASIPPVPTPVPQATQHLAKAPAPPSPVSRQLEAQQTAVKSTHAATSNSTTAAQAAARQTTAASGAAAGQGSQSPRPVEAAHEVDLSEAKPPRSGISAFGVIFWGLVMVAAGLAVAYFADLIDLAPFFQQISAMIEAARNN